MKVEIKKQNETLDKDGSSYKIIVAKWWKP